MATAFQVGRPSVRKLATASTTIFGVLVLVVVAALMWTSSLLQKATTTSIRGTQSMAVADELELSLLTYVRISDLYVMTNEEKLDVARREILAEMLPLLAEAREHVDSPSERQLLGRISEQLAIFLDKRERVEATGASLAEVVRVTDEALEDTLALMKSVRRLNETVVQQAQAQALGVDRIANLAGASAGTLLVLGLVSVVFGVRRYVLRPDLELLKTVVRFRGGDIDARAPELGSSESAALARAFNDMADALKERRDRQLTFLAGVAHDLRNPLNGLRLGVHTLELEGSQARRRRTLALINRQLDRLARMLEDLLDATRIEAGELELQLEEVDVGNVAADIVRLYELTSPDHTIAFEAPDEPLVIQGDSLRIEQVLSNLLSNAVKFSPEGGRVEVSLEADADELVISVRDRGIGIPHDDLDNIFLPFRRRRPEVAPGAGLGLSVVRRIVKAHGGRIEVKSEPGIGSTFAAHFPRQAPVPAAASVAQRSEIRGKGAEHRA